MEGQIESKAMLEQIIQFNNESKLNLSASLKHQEKVTNLTAAIQSKLKCFFF